MACEKLVYENFFKVDGISNKIKDPIGYIIVTFEKRV